MGRREEEKKRRREACKKDGCNGVIPVPVNATHAMGFHCSLCMNKHRYCEDCKTLYINFRKHREHTLSSTQKRNVGCKKDGCNGVIAVPVNATHGMGFHCSLCMNKQRYCGDCKTLYINFRKHRERGHELYRFQRKKPIYLRNENGLFMPGG